MMPSNSRKTLFTSRSRTNYQLQEEQSKHVISDCDDKQQLNRIKSSSAHLSLELGLQLLKRSSGMVTWGLGREKKGRDSIKPVYLNFLVSFWHGAVEERSPTGPRPWRLQRSSRTDCLWCWCWCWLEWGGKKITGVHFWHSCPQNNAGKNIKGLGKAFKGRKKLNNWADPQNLCTQGLIIIIEIALLPPSHIDFGIMLPSVSILTLNLL